MIWGTLFSGGGGVDEGLKMAGHQVAWGIEMMPQIAACFKSNHPDTKLIVSDLRNVVLSTLPAITALWASPVCKQDSDARNKTLAPREDASIGLAVIRYIEHFKPELVILENVDGYRKNPTLTTLIAYLSRHYSISERVLNAANYGVPQNRKRLIIQARRGPIAWPEYAPHCPSWFEILQAHQQVLEPAALIDWQKARWLPEYDEMLPLLVHGHFAFKRDGEDGRRLTVTPSWKSMPTVTSSHNNRDKRLVMPDGQVYRLTPAAIGLLQSFPADYIWSEDTELAYEIIGNAVPPLLVQQLTAPYAAISKKEVA